MNLNKHLSFFDPLNQIKAPIHIIGCGAIGSTLAEMLTRMGVTNLHLYDFDKVSEHNLTNQMFLYEHIGQDKTSALINILNKINPKLSGTIYPKGYTNQPLSGYIFLCVDNIDTRRDIVKEHYHNPVIKAMFDFRMRLTDAQHYSANWQDVKEKEDFLASMQFSHGEAKEATPTNACGTHLNINPTVRGICSLGLSNFINFIKEGQLKKLILFDSFHYMLDAF